MGHFKYLGTTLSNQNCIHEEIKSRLNLENACYHSVQNILFFSLLFNIYIYIIFSVVSVCETWPLTLREENKLRVVENGVLRKIFGPKRDEVTGGGGDNTTVIFMNLYTLPNIRVIKLKIMTWAGRGGERCVHGVLGKSERKRPFGRPRCKWEDNIKIDLQEVGWRAMDWIDLSQGQVGGGVLMHAIMNFRVP